MSDLKILVGKRIRAMRKAKGWSQATLAEHAEMVDSYLAGVERGERNISLESLEKIVRALEAEPIDAFRFGDLELGNGLDGKRSAIRLLVAFLEERSLEEIELVRRLTKEVMTTIDVEKRKSNE